MQASGQATIGVIARAALIARGHMLDAEEDDGGGNVPPPPISDEDRADLARYFSEDRVRDHDGGGSNFNAMLDRMALYAKTSKPCTKCGGVREKRDRDTGEIITEEQSGTGIAVGSKEFSDWKQLEALCHRPTDRAAIRNWVRTTNGGDNWCKACEGRGWVLKWRNDPKRPPDVRITGQQPKVVPASTVGGSEILSLLGRVGRKRAAMRTMDPVAEAALSAWFSPDGGTIPGLWHLTPMGRKMLEENELGRPHQAFFRSLQIAQAANRNPHREHQFTVATRQAHLLLHRMRRAWHRVSAG